MMADAFGTVKEVVQAAFEQCNQGKTGEAVALFSQALEQLYQQFGLLFHL